METIGFIVVIVSFFAAIFGIINIIHPIKRLRIHKRLIGLFIVLGSVVGCTGGAVLGVAGQPGGWGAEMARQEADRKAAEAASPTPATAGPAPKAEPARPAGMTQAEFETTWSAVKASTAPCDNQVAAAGRLIGAGDVYAAYPAVQRAQATCSNAMSAISDVSIPRSAKVDVRRAMEDARSTCSTSAFVKFQAMEKVAKVVDGDSRPSAVAAAQADMEAAQGYQMRCIVGFMGAAQKAGLVLPEIRDGAASDAE